MEAADSPAELRIGLAAVRNEPSVDLRLRTLNRFLGEAAEQDVAVVCFPETYIPGLRGLDFSMPPRDQCRQQAALEAVCAVAKRYGVAAVVGMEWESEVGLHNAAVVVSRDGTVQGWQVKNQIPPQEEPFYVPGHGRQLFEVDGVPFGIAICHEGWRYPESVRWAARRGARLVFHPHMTGSDSTGVPIARWATPARRTTRRR